MRPPGDEGRKNCVQPDPRRQLAVDVGSRLVESASRQPGEPHREPPLGLGATDVHLDTFHPEPPVDPHGPVTVDGDIGHVLVRQQRLQRTCPEQLGPEPVSDRRHSVDTQRGQSGAGDPTQHLGVGGAPLPDLLPGRSG